MENKICISVIICTRNRAQSLSRCLESVSKMIAPFPWELIIVDNGSSDNTSDVVFKFKKTHNLYVKYTYAEKPGLGRARNFGIRLAEGEIIVFTDDDCYPESDYLIQVKRVFDNPNIGFFGGRVILHDPEDYPVTIQLKKEKELLPPGTFIKPGLIHGANMGFRKKVFKTIGGFNELLGAGTPLSSGVNGPLKVYQKWP